MGGDRADRVWYVPSADEVSSLEIFDQRFWGRQADKNIRVEGAADSRFGRSLFDIPRRWGVNRSHGDLCVLHGLDDSRERIPDLTREAEAWTS